MKPVRAVVSQSNFASLKCNFPSQKETPTRHRNTPLTSYGSLVYRDKPPAHILRTSTPGTALTSSTIVRKMPSPVKGGRKALQSQASVVTTATATEHHYSGCGSPGSLTPQSSSLHSAGSEARAEELSTPEPSKQRTSTTQNGRRREPMVAPQPPPPACEPMPASSEFSMTQTPPKGRAFVPSRILREAASVCGCVVASPSGAQLVVDKLLQSAIYGGVYRARECLELREAGGSVWRTRRVALKIMLKELEKKNGAQLQEDIMAEVRLQREMNGHVNVLAYDEIWEDHECVYVVMAFAEYEDMFEVLRKRAVPFAEKEARWMFSQLLDAAHYLHSRRIAFRDHSLENVLMFRNAEDGSILPKITDPGQAVHISVDPVGRVKGMVADRLFGKSFRPPEVYSKQPYNPVKVDTFCLGWMLFFTVTKHQAFDRALDSDAHWSLIRKGLTSTLLRQRGGEHISQQLTDLLSKMLHPDFSKRPTPLQCLAHPWFRNQRCVVDDRTIYSQNGMTVDRLPMHPELLKKQLLRKQMSMRAITAAPKERNEGNTRRSIASQKERYEGTWLKSGNSAHVVAA